MYLKVLFKSGLGILLVQFLLILICITIHSSMIGKLLLMQLVLLAPFFWIITLALGIKNFNCNKTFSKISITISIVLLSIYLISNLFEICKGLGINV